MSECKVRYLPLIGKHVRWRLTHEAIYEDRQEGGVISYMARVPCAADVGFHSQVVNDTDKNWRDTFTC